MTAWAAGPDHTAELYGDLKDYSLLPIYLFCFKSNPAVGKLLASNQEQLINLRDIYGEPASHGAWAGCPATPGRTGLGLDL